MVNDPCHSFRGQQQSPSDQSFYGLRTNGGGVHLVMAPNPK